MAKGCEDVAKMLRQHFADRRWTPWLYNQAVGWLRVYAYPREAEHATACVNGEYFAVDAQRLSKDVKRKRYLWAAEAFAVAFGKEIESRAVFDRISQEIQEWSKTGGIRRLTLDLEVWNNIGPHTDWHAILWHPLA
jgi:hypothetical protein